MIKDPDTTDNRTMDGSDMTNDPDDGQPHDGRPDDGHSADERPEDGPPVHMAGRQDDRGTTWMRDQMKDDLGKGIPLLNVIDMVSSH